MTAGTDPVNKTRNRDANRLPAAPMAMPEQVLERRDGYRAFRLLIMPWLAWK